MEPWKRRFLFGNHHFQVPCLFSGVYMLLGSLVEPKQSKNEYSGNASVLKGDDLLTSPFLTLRDLLPHGLYLLAISSVTFVYCERNFFTRSQVVWVPVLIYWHRSLYHHMFYRYNHDKLLFSIWRCYNNYKHTDDSTYHRLLSYDNNASTITYIHT